MESVVCVLLGRARARLIQIPILKALARVFHDSLFSSGSRSVSRNMSNSVSRNLLQQSLLRPIALEHQSKLNSSSIPANTLFQSAATKTAKTQKSQLSSEFVGKSLSLRRGKHTMGLGHRGADITRSVLATDPASQVKFLLSFMCASVSYKFIWTIMISFSMEQSITII